MRLVVRRALAELVGTAFLVLAVIGSGISASRLSPADTGLALLENSVATGAVLVALITALQRVSASFNPVVTLVELASGTEGWAAAATLIAAQSGGGVAGVVAANVMFGLDVVAAGSPGLAGPGQWLGESVSTAGLVLVVFGTVRSGRPDRVAYAVGGYIAAASWFTSSASCNPALTIARTMTGSLGGIAPAAAPGLVLAQLVGGLLGLVLVRVLFRPPGAMPSAEPEGVSAVDPPGRPEVRSGRQ